MSQTPNLALPSLPWQPLAWNSPFPAPPELHLLGLCAVRSSCVGPQASAVTLTAPQGPLAVPGAVFTAEKQLGFRTRVGRALGPRVSAAHPVYCWTGQALRVGADTPGWLQRTGAACVQGLDERADGAAPPPGAASRRREAGPSCGTLGPTRPRGWPLWFTLVSLALSVSFAGLAPPQVLILGASQVGPWPLLSLSDLSHLVPRWTPPVSLDVCLGCF